MNVVNTNQSSPITAKDLLDAYVSKIITVEGRLESLETRLENSIQSLEANLRQDATFDNDNFKEVRKDISDIKKEIVDVRKELSDIDKTVTDNIHNMELYSKDTDAEQDKKLRELELKTLGIGAGSGTLTTAALQIALEVIKNWKT